LSSCFGANFSIGVDGAFMHQYFVKVIPTRYNFLNGTVLDTNQFAFTKHDKQALVTHEHSHVLPGTLFFFLGFECFMEK